MKQKALPFAILAGMLLFSCGNSHDSSNEQPLYSNPSTVDTTSAKATDLQPAISQYELDKAAVNDVLQQDSKNGAIHDGNDSLIVVGMRAIDLSKCPRDFAVAYVDHMHAWEHSADIQEELKYMQSDQTQ